MVTGINTDLKWFASRAIENRPYILKFLEIMGCEILRIQDVPSLIFIHCTTSDILKLKSELWGYLYVYRKAGAYEPDPIPDKRMEVFRVIAPMHDKPVMYMSVDDPDFLKGQLKRVTKGIFAGSIGVIKRVKGERRLIIKVSDHGVLVTPYIPRDCLEDVEGDPTSIR